MVDLRSRWPNHLVKCIAERNFVCFVGSGLSSSCVNDEDESPPGWSTLITTLAADLSLNTATQKSIKRLLKGSQYLEAAELLRMAASDAGRDQDLNTRLAEMVDAPRGHNFRPSEWHDQLLRLDPSVIVTTNYDRILERLTDNGFNTHLPDSAKIDSDLRTGTPVLIKMHGSVDRKEEMVLCQTDFAQLRRGSAHVFDILTALVTTRTCLFLGYSLQDPDVNMVMQNVMGARGLASAHFMLTPKAQPAFKVRAAKIAYGVTPVEYKGGDHQEGLSTLTALADAVEEEKASLGAPDASTP